MGLAFWGGFASGMSKSIEKSKDRKQKQDKIQADAIEADKKIIRKQNKDTFELGKVTKEAFMEMNERISKIKSGDIALSEQEAVNEINYLNKQKIDMYTRAIDYGMTLNVKDPKKVIDINQEDITQIGIFKDGEERYVVNKELGEALDNNNGEIRLGKNGEIERWKTIQNSKGQWIPEKHENGEFMYESSGEFLQKTSDVFKTKVETRRATSLEQDKQAWQDEKDAVAAYKKNPTQDNLDEMNFARSVRVKRTLGTGEAGELSERYDIRVARDYGKSIMGDVGLYDYDTAEEDETNFMQTDRYNKNTLLKKDEEKFHLAKSSFEQNKGLFDIFDAAVKDGSYTSGIPETIGNVIGAYTNQEFRDFIGLDIKAIKSRLGLEGQIGDGVATYLKGLSGTAASQAEFERTLGNFIGRDMTQEDIKQTVFENFITKKSRDIDVLAKSLARRGLVQTGGEWLTRNKKKKQEETYQRGEVSSDGKTIFDGNKWIPYKQKG